jgi:predicted neutral ceramidase superfamily lipid hydrolase
LIADSEFTGSSCINQRWVPFAAHLWLKVLLKRRVSYERGRRLGSTAAAFLTTVTLLAATLLTATLLTAAFLATTLLTATLLIAATTLAFSILKHLFILPLLERLLMSGGRIV